MLNLFNFIKSTWETIGGGYLLVAPFAPLIIQLLKKWLF